jgi:hypothetical protein
MKYSLGKVTVFPTGPPKFPPIAKFISKKKGLLNGHVSGV